MEINDDIINKLKLGAEEAFKKNEIPVSCVIIDSEGNIVSTGINDRQSRGNVLGHAEINAILEAEEKIKDWRLDGYSMIVSLEPCDMCNAIINECRLDKVYYFLPKKIKDINITNTINKEEIKGFQEDKEFFLKLLTTFFDNKR
jgi:tRNA(Arg) A34 adenosine deaminase TadA